MKDFNITRQPIANIYAQTFHSLLQNPHCYSQFYCNSLLQHKKYSTKAKIVEIERNGSVRLSLQILVRYRLSFTLVVLNRHFSPHENRAVRKV